MRFQFTERIKEKIINRGTVLIAAVLFSALLVRTLELEERPMHVDEAVHAVKFGELLENGSYKYDPVEYHGPTLNYLSLISAFFLGETELKQVDETTLRIIPALMGVLLIAGFLLLKEYISLRLLIIILLFTSLSAPLVFYSRYYIQESLLVSFNYIGIIFFYRYIKRFNLPDIIFSGTFFGLAFASKETFIISAGSVIFSGIVFTFVNRKNYFQILSYKPVFLFVISFVIISVILYSSFFSNWEGVIDSVTTYLNYFDKAQNFNDHIYPWHYYFKLVLFREIEGFYYSEIIIVILSLYGIYASLKVGNNLFRFISVYTLLLILIYSLIPYKTPWSMLSFWTGIIILSAYGFNALLLKFYPRFSLVFGLLITVISLYLLVSVYIINFVHSFHPRNPFVYSHATNDVKIIGSQVEKLIRATNDNSTVSIIAAENDYWPLPWYLRKASNTAWLDSVNESVVRSKIIIAAPELEEDLLEILYNTPPPGSVNLYIPLFEEYMEIRPRIEIRGYIQQELYNQYLRETEQ